MTSRLGLRTPALEFPRTAADASRGMDVAKAARWCVCWVDDLLMFAKSRVAAEIVIAELVIGLRNVGWELDVSNEDRFSC